jgi:DNA-binding MarR family transcriptional regulator
MKSTKGQDISERRKPTHVEDMVPEELSSYRAARQSKLVRRARDAEAEKLGVTVDEWRLLYVLARHGPLPSIRMAEFALMDRGTVSRGVARMEKHGLVFRLSDAKDGRVWIVNLTEKGQTIAAQISDYMLQRELDMISTLTDEEWRIWLRVTDKFYEHLLQKFGDDD